MASRFGKLVVGSVVTSAFWLIPCLAAADQVSATLQVSLRVVTACNVITQPLTLADYATGGPATGTAAAGGIDVTCAHGTPVAVYLDGNRTLRGPSGAAVAYEVQANGNPWRAGEAIRVTGLGRTPVHLALTGSVPAGQKIPVGDYGDQVVVRVVY